MSIEVKPGRWRTRGGEIAIVEGRSSSGHGFWEWCGRLENGRSASWATDGRFALEQGPSDLVEFLGPLRDAPASDSKWVPGFIWVTAFRWDGKEVVEKWPFLVDISSIEVTAENTHYRSAGLHCGRLVMKNANAGVESYSVLETPEEIGELIRDNWLKCH